MAASGVAAVASLIILPLASLFLPDHAYYNEFLTFWGLLFGLFQVVAGTQNEYTRAVASSEGTHPQGPRVWHVALGSGAVLAVGILSTSMWWAPSLLPTNTTLVTCLIAVTVVAYCCHIAMSGSFSGQGSWRHYSGMMALEAIGRAGLVVGLGLGIGGLFSLEVGTMAACLVWTLWLIGGTSGREAFGFRLSDGPVRIMKNMAMVALSSAAAAVLINGFPALMEATLRGMTSPEALAEIKTGLALTRAPLMIPLLALQGMAIRAFVNGSGGARVLAKLAAVIVAAGALLAAVMYVIGGYAAQLLFPNRAITSETLLWCTVAVIPLPLITLTGAAVLAANRHVHYTVGWVLAAAVTVGALVWLPLSPMSRVVASLTVGATVGLLVHALGLGRGAAKSVDS